MTPDTTAFDAAMSAAMGGPARRVPSEADLLGKVIRTARRERILVFHAYDSRATTGKGFPDLVLVGSSRHMFAELKMPGATLTIEQADWRWRLWSAGAWWATWTPRDHHSGEVTRVMRWLHEPGDLAAAAAAVPLSLQHQSRWRDAA